MAPLGLGAAGAIVVYKNKLPHGVFTNRVVEYAVLLLLLITLATDYAFKLPVLGLCSLFLVLKAALYNFSCTFLNQLLHNKRVLYIDTAIVCKTVKEDLMEWKQKVEEIINNE